MFCSKCGYKNNEDARYCINCGNMLNNNVNNNNDNALTKAYKRKSTSTKIGIISLIILFVTRTLAILLAIIGLVIGIKEKEKRGIIINIICIIISILFILGGIILNFVSEFEENNYIGEYACSDYVENSTNALEETMKFSLKKDKTFLMTYSYSTASGIIDGTYEITGIKYTTKNNENYTTYTINFDANTRVINGEKITEPYVTQYNLIIADTSEVYLQNTISNSLYLCRKIES